MPWAASRESASVSSVGVDPAHETRIEFVPAIFRNRIDDRSQAREKVRAEGLHGVLEPRVLFLHHGAEIGQNLDRRLNQVGDLRVDVGVAQVPRIGDAHSAHTVVEPHAPVAGLVRNGEPIARVRLREDRQQERAVGNRPRDWTVMDGVGKVVRGIHGYATRGGLDAENAREGAWHTDRAPAVTADVECAHARGTRRRGAAARAAGRQIRVPGIPRGARKRAVGDAFPPVFRCRGLAEKHRAVLAHARRGRRIDVPRGPRPASSWSHAASASLSPVRRP